jgi:hypothetical protein
MFAFEPQQRFLTIHGRVSPLVRYDGVGSRPTPKPSDSGPVCTGLGMRLTPVQR